MKPYQVEFVIPQLPKRPNEQLRLNAWKTKKAERARWTKLVHLVTAGRRPRAPLKRARLVLERHSSSCPDYDGLAGSFKMLIDSLVILGFIEDDNMEVIGRPDFRWFKAPQKKGFIRVRIEEVVE